MPDRVRPIIAIACAACAACGTTAPASDAASSTPDASPDAAAARPFSPCGIYVLDSPAGTDRDGNLRDQPFVRGYVLRLRWTDIEPSQGAYDFSVIDHVLARAEGVGQHVSLLFSNFEGDADPPDVVAAAAQTWTFTDQNANHSTYGMTFRRPVPWDANAQQRYAEVLTALADHPVTWQGQMVRLADHPALAAINFGVLGLGAVRELDASAPLASFPGYSRPALRASALAALSIQTDRFPRVRTYLGLWGVTDGADPPLWEDVLGAILGTYDGVGHPRVGLWQENLAGTAVSFTPTTTYAAPLYEGRTGAEIMFQALTSWARPFTGMDKVAGGSPVTAAAWALATYGARYVELYASDIDAAVAGTSPWSVADLTALDQQLCQGASP